MWSLRIILLAAVLLPGLMAPLGAQRPVARIHLKNGKVVEGPVLKANDEHVVLRLPDMQITISASDIERIVPLSDTGVDDAAPLPEPLRVEELRPVAVAETVEASPPGRGEQPNSARQRAGQTAGAAGTGARVGGAADPPINAGPDSHLSRWLERYMWLIPQSGGHRASVGAGVLLMLVLILQWSGRLAGVETITFARSFAVGVVLFGAVIVQLSLDVEHPLLLIGMLFLDVVIYYVLARLVLGAGLLSATVMQVCWVLSCLLMVLAIEVMGYVLQQHDHVS